MNTQSRGSSVLPMKPYGLLSRVGLVVGFLTAETLLLSGLMKGTPWEQLGSAARLTQEIRHWAFRFAVTYAASFAILLYLRGARTVAVAAPEFQQAPLRLKWLLLHALLLVPLALLWTMSYRDGAAPLLLLAVLWLCVALAAALALLAGVAPLSAWAEALRESRALQFYSLIPTAAALLLFKASQLLWRPAAAATFSLVRTMVQLFYPSALSDATTLTLSTDHFSVHVAEVCSGLEGVGLMLVFCAAWLWYFRRDYVFPRALIIVPAAVLLIFLLNAVRIAALVLIGEAGYPGIATVGFHSQAGWIAFNAAAFGVAFIAKRSNWLSRTNRSHIREHEATAAYLMPLLAILAAGMLAHALSAGFDLLYPLRLVCGAAALFVFHRSYRSLDWGFSWRGVVTGLAIFCIWAGFARFLTSPAAMAGELSSLSAPLRAAWIICRITAAIITVPIAEELAYRGFLMRRIVNADFAAVPWRSVPYAAIAASAVAFGITHGSLWLPGILAGVGYGALAVRTGKFGESVAAHATTNALIAVQVLLFGEWQLW